MQQVLFSLLAGLTLTSSFARADIIDDFSAGGWRQSSSTPGEMAVEPGKMVLKDAPREPGWMMVSKPFKVDFEKTPFFLVMVTDVSYSGTVKLIRTNPYAKRVALNIDRPGLYAVNMRRQFGWRETGVVEACLYANGAAEQITYEYVKFAAKLSPKEEALIKARPTMGNTRLHVRTFEVVPLFNTCSFYLPSTTPLTLSVTYRKKGGDWLAGMQPVYVAEDNMFRGSIVGLTEDTVYEIRIMGARDAIVAHTEFKTWRSDVPVAKTVVLDQTAFTGHLVINDQGTPDGWIKYTAKNGFVLRNDRTGPLLELDKAKYVILEGLTLRGGLQDAISITKCEYVRVVNCDIADWGRIGTQRFDLDGKYYTKTGRAINWDAAILLRRSTGTVVERCYIHDPVSTANSWYYSHPAGPQAVGIDKPRSTVIRYNDFVGSDLHRWNDAMEGAGNFHVDGGFNRDADIYGNLACFANDDAVEIDGGQTNVRVFLNKFEGCLCGVSIQGCMSGPSYVFHNLLVNMGDEHGVGGQTIKTSSFANGKSAVSFIFNNTCYGDSSDLSLPHNLRIVAKNNIFAGRSAISGRTRSPQSECDYNLLATGKEGDEEHGIVGAPDFVAPGAGLFGLKDGSPAIGHGVAIANFAVANKGPVDMGAIPFNSDVVLPVRPIPVCLDRYQLMFSPADSGAAKPRSVTAAVSGAGFASAYRIVQNDAFDWFRVAPRNGMLESGQKVAFTVTPVPEKMRNSATFRGAFLLRLANGYSRPVMVYAKTNFVPAIKPSREGVFVQYLEAETAFGTHDRANIQDALASSGICHVLSGATSRDIAEYRFSVPRAGKYFVLMRVRSDEPVSAHDRVRFAVDNGPLDEACLLSATSWRWSLVAANRQQRLTRLQAFALSAGEHVLRLAPRQSIYLDLIAVTDNPALFD